MYKSNRGKLNSNKTNLAKASRNKRISSRLNQKKANQLSKKQGIDRKNNLEKQTLKRRELEKRRQIIVEQNSTMLGRNSTDSALRRLRIKRASNGILWREYEKIFVEKVKMLNPNYKIRDIELALQYGINPEVHHSEYLKILNKLGLGEHHFTQFIIASGKFFFRSKKI